MALIKIRGRLEPVVVDDERAKRIKERKFGKDGVGAALPNELIDLGDWAGEYGRIVEVELSKKSSDASDPMELEKKRNKEERDKWLAQPVKYKANTVGWFKILYATRMGDFKAEPPADVLEKVVALHERLYAADKFLIPMRIGASEYGDLLPPKKSGNTKLGAKMRITHNDDVIYPL